MMLYYLWMGMIIVGILLFILALILTFIWKIPDLMDELSGRKAKRQIKRLKEINQGTGSEVLDNISTNDIYSMSSGNLLSREIILPEQSSSSSESSKKISPNSVISRGENSEDLDEDEVATSEMGISDETEYIPESDVTGHMSEDEVSNILSGVKDFCNNKKIITVLEEQSSL